MGFIQYLKDTRGELHHVAWPTRLQTIIYTILVIALSLFVAAYLGFFDYIFTNILSSSLQFLPQAPIEEFIPGTGTSTDFTFTPSTDPAGPTGSPQSE